MTTETTALTVPQRAAVALGTAKHEVELRDLVQKSTSIVAIKNKDGREECHSALMTLRNARTSIEKVGKAAREDATAFSKAVIAEEKRLITITQSEEDRLQGLRDKWDAEIEAERQRAVEAERQRIAAILERIDVIRNLPLAAVGKSSQDVREIGLSITRLSIDESFQEFQLQATNVRLEVLERLADMEVAQCGIEAHQEEVRQEAERQRIAKEKADAKLKAEQEAESKRLAAERAELEQLRKAQAERDAAAKKEREAAEEKARAEQEAIDKKRREEHAAAQAEIKAAQDKMNAERAQIEADRAEVARAQAMIDQAKQDVIDAAERKEADHAKALAWNAALDEERAKPALVVEDVFDINAAAGEALYADFKPTAAQIVGCVAYSFEVTDAQALEWLRGIDFSTGNAQERKAA